MFVSGLSFMQYMDAWSYQVECEVVVYNTKFRKLSLFYRVTNCSTVHVFTKRHHRVPNGSILFSSDAVG